LAVPKYDVTVLGLTFRLLLYKFISDCNFFSCNILFTNTLNVKSCPTLDITWSNFSYSNLLLMLVVFFSIMLAIFAPEIIRILAPVEYYSAIWVIPPIVLGLYFSFLSSLFANIEFYYKKNIFVTLATSSAAILNIILNAIFIPKFGFVAAGYTTAIGYLVLAIAHYIFMKKIQSNNIYDLKMLLLISIVLVVIIFLIIYLYNYMIICFKCQYDFSKNVYCVTYTIH